MINNEWERFGEDIRRTIQNAVDSRDFSRLNQTVSDTIGQAMNTISRGLHNGGWYREPGNPRQYGHGNAPGYGDERERTGEKQAGRTASPGADTFYGSNYGKRNTAVQNSASPFYLKGTSAKIGGVFLAVTGGVFGLASVAFFLFFVISSIFAGWDALNVFASVGIGIFMIAFAVMFGAGLGMAAEAGRFGR